MQAIGDETVIIMRPLHRSHMNPNTPSACKRRLSESRRPLVQAIEDETVIIMRDAIPL